MTAAASRVPALEAGAMLGGRYVIECELARGGSSSIWRARDARLGRRVAIKIVEDEIAAPREASMLARCAGRGVVACYEVSAPTPTPTLPHKGGGGQSAYLVLEYVDGVNLAQRLRDGARLTAGEALRVALDVARGLAHVHAAGVVHGDIKPQHLVLTRDGVTLVDFGDARPSVPTLSPAATVGSVPDGTGGEGWGGGDPAQARATAAYAAPESLEGCAPSTQSDLYALGIVLARLGEHSAISSEEWDARLARLAEDAPAARGDARMLARDLEGIAAHLA